MYYKLESLRGLAACFIVLYHSPFNFFEESGDFIRNAYLFVDMFFILSGFIISYAYTEKISNELPFKKFLVLRLARIYPLHFFMLCVFACFILLKAYLYSRGFGGDQDFHRNNIYSFISNVFLIQSLGLHDYLSFNIPSWSISVEFFTYIIFFFFLRVIDSKKGFFVPGLIIIFCYYFLFLLGTDNLDFTYDVAIFRAMAGFYVGVVLFRIRPKIISCNINFMELASVVIVIYAVSHAHLSWAYQFLTITSFFILLGVCCSSKNGIIGWTLQTPIMRMIGKWSFSIYMVHTFVISVITLFIKYVIKLDPQTIHGEMAVLVNFIILMTVIIISCFTFKYIEDKYRNIIKLKINEVH